MKQPWFSNKGQIIQIALQVVTILIGLKLWPAMSANRMMTAGGGRWPFKNSLFLPMARTRQASRAAPFDPGSWLWLNEMAVKAADPRFYLLLRSCHYRPPAVRATRWNLRTGSWVIRLRIVTPRQRCS